MGGRSLSLEGKVVQLYYPGLGLGLGSDRQRFVVLPAFQINRVGLDAVQMFT